MALNLISDSWIPVKTTGGRSVVRPDEIARDDVLFPDWARPDLNLACIELLIGLLFMASPPADADDWEARRRPDPDRLRHDLAQYAPAFDLDGDGPRFMQDLESFEGDGDANPVDMLFIDSSGGNTARNNADLMVHRGRYGDLSPAEAAMALYTLQAFAPSGGAGNRTSMRGGGPLTTIVIPRPDCSLFDIVWANVPDGLPARPGDLPWMKPTRLSDKVNAHVVLPPSDPGLHVETFFGMPRRLRLVFGGNGRATGVVQRPYGNNYAQWVHPLTPYYQLKAGQELLPVHPRAGRFGYRNWLGILCEAEEGSGRFRAEAVRTYQDQHRVRSTRDARVLVGGWAMDNMKPRDFAWSIQPLVALDRLQAIALRGLVRAAEMFAGDLRARLKPLIGEKSALDSAVESFFQRTEDAFSARLADLLHGRPVGEAWRDSLRQAALGIYDAIALNGFEQRDAETIEEIARGRGYLAGAFNGHGKVGAAACDLLGLPLPSKKGNCEP